MNIEPKKKAIAQGAAKLTLRILRTNNTRFLHSKNDLPKLHTLTAKAMKETNAKFPKLQALLDLTKGDDIFNTRLRGAILDEFSKYISEIVLREVTNV